MTASTTIVPTVADQEKSRRELLHSGNSGFMVHRVGQSKYGFHSEALQFSWALMDYMNSKVGEYVTTRGYEEIFGTRGNLHWLVHMKSPSDYSRLLKMVDHDNSFRKVVDEDRLPASGGGGSWEKVYIESSYKETILVPQHGLDRLMETEGLNPDYEESEGFFASPAQHQTSIAADQLLHSGNAGAIIHRKGQLKYEFRNEGRAFAFEWSDYFNRSMPGKVTSFLYEEGWGSQDRVHLLIHLKDLDQCKEIVKREREDPAFRAIFTKEFVAAHKGGGTWGRMFVEGTLQDTLLVPASKPSLG
jgi:uncharacterized protein DUF6039